VNNSFFHFATSDFTPRHSINFKGGISNMDIFAIAMDFVWISFDGKYSFVIVIKTHH